MPRFRRAERASPDFGESRQELEVFLLTPVAALGSFFGIVGAASGRRLSQTACVRLVGKIIRRDKVEMVGHGSKGVQILSRVDIGA